LSNATEYLLRLRVRWYLHAVRQFEVKFRQAAILIFGLGPGLLLLAIIPYWVSAIVGPELDLASDFFFLCLFEILCLLWVMCCADAVKGEPLDRYIQTLPLNGFQRYSVDLAVLCLANLIGWVLLIAGLCLVLHKESSVLNAILLLLRTALLAALVITVQIIWFRGARYFIAFVLPINFLFIESKGLHSFWLLLGVAGLMALIFILNLFTMAHAAGLQYQGRWTGEVRSTKEGS